jgi:hypothetical protein
MTIYSNITPLNYIEICIIVIQSLMKSTLTKSPVFSLSWDSYIPVLCANNIVTCSANYVNNTISHHLCATSLHHSWSLHLPNLLYLVYLKTPIIQFSVQITLSHIVQIMSITLILTIYVLLVFITHKVYTYQISCI